MPDSPDRLRFSFEFFPPRGPEQEDVLFDSARRLRQLDPDFASVTYGASGSTRKGTLRTVTRLREEEGFNAAAHLTCVDARRDEINRIARGYWEAGIRHIVALRGDPRSIEGVYRPAPGGYAYASDLVGGLRELADFEISVAAFPETHPEAISACADLENLKRKLDAGAARAITQFFFDADLFLRFRDRAIAAGIDAPIVPGILPIRNYRGARKFAEKCGTSVPTWLDKLFRIELSPREQAVRGGLIALELCRSLVIEGVKEFHFYTLNRAEPTVSICTLLLHLFEPDDTTPKGRNASQ